MSDYNHPSQSVEEDDAQVVMLDINDPNMINGQALFNVGQLVEHRVFHYRGVVVDVDPVFMGTDQWYEKVARSQPPKDAPWYRVLVHNSDQETYVAERNLKDDISTLAIEHPLVDWYFKRFDGQKYHAQASMN